MPIRKYLHLVLWFTSLKSTIDGNMNCSLTTDSENWTVFGACIGTFPPFKDCQMNSHLCRWNESFSYKGNVTRTFSGHHSAESGANDVNCRVRCLFKAALPVSEGKYSYTVEIVNVTSNISLEILSPEPPSVSSCPMFAPNSNDSSVTCNCTTPKYGHPSGILTWPGYSNTSQVTVSRSDQDSVFTCQLKWGAQNWTVVYNPRPYPPTHPPVISGYTYGQLILTGSSLTLTCRVTGGHPLVSSIEFNCGPYAASQSAKFKDSVISTLILDELSGSHDGILCSCSAIWPPDPHSYPYVTSVTLKVVDRGLVWGTIIGPASFVVIAVIIIGIIFAKRRANRRLVWGTIIGPSSVVVIAVIIIAIIFAKSRANGNMNCSLTTYSANWTVGGVCDGTFPPFKECQNNPHLCRWNESFSYKGNVIRTFSGQYSAESVANYVNCRVTCSFKAALPASEGKYSYTVEIDNITSNISLEILSPEQPSVSSCPMFAPKSNESRVTCNCTTPKYGHPSGILTWPGYSNTSQITVSRSDQDSVFTCQLTWGAQNWTVVYNPRLYPPAHLPMISGYKSGQLLLTGSTLTLTCRVTGGHPLVSSIEFKCGSYIASQSAKFKDSVISTFILDELNGSHDGILCSCNATWPPDPQSYPYVTSVTLKVVDIGLFLGTIIGSASFVVIAVIIITIIVVKRRTTKAIKALQDVTSQGSTSAPEQNVQLTGVYTEITDVDYRPSDREINISQPKCSSEANACTHIVKIPKRANTVVRAKAASNDGMCHSQEARRKSEANSDIYNILSHTQKESSSKQLDPLYNHCKEATSKQPDPLYNNCNEATSKQPDPLYNHCNEATSRQPDPLYNHCNEATSKQLDPLYNHCNEATSRQPDPLYNHCNEATSRQPDPLYNHCNEATSRQPDPLYNHCNEATSKQPDPLYNHCNEATSRQPDPLYNHCNEATSKQLDPLYNHCNEATSRQPDLLYNHCNEATSRQPDPLYNHCNEATSKQPDPLYNHCNEATSRQPDPLYNHCIEATSRQPDPLYNHCNEAFSSQTDLLFNNCIESVIKTT